MMDDLCECPQCPRCGAIMAEPLVRNALSRVDNQTWICSSCGVDEAVWQVHHIRNGVADPLPPLGRKVFGA